MIGYILNNFGSLESIKGILAQATQQTEALQDVTFDFSRLADSDALVISAVGYVVVFAALVILYFFFANVTKALNYNLKKKLKAEGKTETTDDLDMPAEVTVAIAAALQRHFAEVHDFEHTVLTIKKVQRPYSPWSSKIYGLREYPKK